MALFGATMLVAACSSGPRVETTSTDARVMTGSGVTGGDCVEARRRAAEKPDLEVERLPALTAQSPRPFLRMPANVKALVNRQGASVKASVVIDTLGRPVMSTFRIEESKPHAWLGQNVRSIIPRWKFSPAELAGCKVPRTYKFSATAPKRG
jgi:hypothetical protein